MSRFHLAMSLFLGVATAVLVWLWSATAAADSAGVSTYHADRGRSGNFIVPSLTYDRARSVHPDSGFNAEFAGHVYAQPLYWRGNLIVVTEDNTVEAIDGGTGREVWRRTLGTPVPRNALPCGDIDPLGVTGTPVITANGTLYVDAAVITRNGPRHEVFALSLANGAVLPGWPADVATALAAKGANFIPRDLNERGALTILGNRVYVAYSGHFGDCGDYRGWVVGVALNNPKDVIGWATAARGGGIWGPGGVVTDGRSLFVTTGNTFGAAEWSDGEAVIRLSPELTFSRRSNDYFTPADWHSLDQRDLDLGGSNPVLFDAGGRALLLALGKDGNAYLLDHNNLGGIGGAVAQFAASSSPIRTGAALFPVQGGVFVAIQGSSAQCTNRGDLTVLKILTEPKPVISTAWCGQGNGRGSPIVTTTDGHSNPIVWMVGAEGDGRLRGFNGDNGALLFTSGPMAGTRRFQTLIATPARIYVAADGRVYAYAF
ncbi:MAG: PQQ-binding-like beta-propeller repeat protein [Alphaproteobacteria bacterium]|nr:PQQ-binding-like beta-propeller repeat protein [Alphaproteobacteria bacterium]